MSRSLPLLSFALLGLLAGCSTVENLPATTRSASTLDERLASGLPSILDRSGAASVSVAHIEDGRIAALQATGLSAPGRAATIETRYNVASLTKPVSAEVVLRLMAEGRFSLDEPMAPTWVDPDIANDRRHVRLTPRMALSHQTGFPNWRDNAGLRFERDPGSGPGYSGEGYEYVATYVARRTGTPIDRHAERLLFGPLGMHATSYTGAPASAVASSRANDVWTAPVTRGEPSAADDLVTTARDYAKFVLSLMQDDGLTPALAAERARVQADRLKQSCTGIPAATCPEQAGFALGWEVLVIDGVPYFMHTGADRDGFSLAYWSPATRSGTVVLTNNPDGYRVVLPVLDLLGADPEFVNLLRAQASR